LAALAALAEPESVAGVVSLYGPMDLETLARTSAVVPAQVRDALDNRALGPLLSEHLRSLSPVAQVRTGAPPFLLIHGTADSVVPMAQSRAMLERLRAAGAQCELVTVQGGGHGLRYWGQNRTSWHKDLIGWLDRTVAKRHA
jgi:dipeptidyl aminopeptidase/acylaminoacyl peptidase